MSRSIIVIHPGALGDALLAVPAMRRLRMKAPTHEILLISQESIGRFLVDCKVADAWRSLQRADVTDLFTGCRTPGSQIKSWCERCDLAVVWMKDENQILERTLTSWGVQDVIVGSSFSPALKARHQSDRFLELIGECEVTCSDDMRVQLPSDLVQMGREYLIRHGVVSDRPVVVIHPGSGSRLKCTQPEIIAAAVTQLHSQGVQVLVLEGPADQEYVNALSQVVHTPLTVLRGLDLSTVAGILSHIQLYMGHDSGITHLAGLVGVPTLAIFGPTDPERWAPRGPHVRILRGMPCRCLSWEEVQKCKEKTCLAIQSDELLDVLGTIEELYSSPLWNPSSRTLSPPDLYAKVAR